MICTHHESVNCPGTLLAALFLSQPAGLGAPLFWPFRERLSNTSTLSTFFSHLCFTLHLNFFLFFSLLYSSFFISCLPAWITFNFTVSYLTFLSWNQNTFFFSTLLSHCMVQSFDLMWFSNFSFPVPYLMTCSAHLSSPSLRLCTVTCPVFVSISFTRVLSIFIMMCVVLQALLVPWCFFASRVSGPD